ncbi:MAG: hypothetical protein AAFV29_19255, partial [Myxococcota bacterium]
MRIPDAGGSPSLAQRSQAERASGNGAADPSRNSPEATAKGEEAANAKQALRRDASKASKGPNADSPRPSAAESSAAESSRRGALARQSRFGQLAKPGLGMLGELPARLLGPKGRARLNQLMQQGEVTGRQAAAGLAAWLANNASQLPPQMRPTVARLVAWLQTMARPPASGGRAEQPSPSNTAEHAGAEAG